MAQQMRALMAPPPVALPGTASVHEVARALRDAEMGDVIVPENAQVSGMGIDHDIVVRTVAAAQDPATTTLADIGSHASVTVPPRDSVEEGVQFMRTHAMRRVPVVDGGQPGGMVSLGDLVVEREPDSVLSARNGAPQCLTGGRPAPPTRRQCLRRMQGRSLWKKCGKRPRRKNHKLGRNGHRARRASAPSRCCSGAFGSCYPPCPPPWRWGTRRLCGTPLR